MVTHNTADVNKITRNAALSSMRQQLREKSVGYCISCGAKVSDCGKPFTDEIPCPKCGVINVYVESQQPTALKKAMNAQEI